MAALRMVMEDSIVKPHRDVQPMEDDAGFSAVEISVKALLAASPIYEFAHFVNDALNPQMCESFKNFTKLIDHNAEN